MTPYVEFAECIIFCFYLAFEKRMNSINRQRSSRRMSDWMDNQDVCQALKISPRTLQTLRDSGRLPHSKINNRIYYRPEDVERLVENDV